MTRSLILAFIDFEEIFDSVDNLNSVQELIITHSQSFDPYVGQDTYNDNS